MIVKLRTYPDIPGDGTYERMVECDTVYRTQFKDSVKLLLYKDGKMMEHNEFKDKTRVFFLENSKVFDRIDFKTN